MKHIAVINGSPKARESTSEMFIDQIQKFLHAKVMVYQARQFVRRKNTSQKLTYRKLTSKKIYDILKADVLLIVFPLYIDSLPAPLIRILTLIEEHVVTTDGRLPSVYAICNCGFFEAERNQLALQMIEHFSTRTGMSWGYGIGVGCGGAVQLLRKSMIQGKGLAADVYAALRQLGDAIQDENIKRQNVFVAPEIPRFWYMLNGNMHWQQMAKQYRTEKSLRAKPHLE